MPSDCAPRTDRNGQILSIRPATTAPDGAPVRHFDELPERAQQLLADHDARDDVVVTPEVASLFADEPVVVFAEYLRIELT